MQKIYISPAGGQSNKDYIQEEKYFGTGGARWSYGEHDVRVGMLTGFVIDGKLKIFEITSVSTDVDIDCRPWWVRDTYLIKGVIFLSPMLFWVDFQDYVKVH